MHNPYTTYARALCNGGKVNFILASGRGFLNHWQTVLLELDEALRKVESNPRVPHIHSFPHNCCEIASLNFGDALESYFPSDEIILVGGRGEIFKGQHFWLELRDLVLDLTAHQFDDIFAEPFACYAPGPHDWQRSIFKRVKIADAKIERDAMKIYPQLTDLFSSILAPQMENLRPE